MTSKNSWFSLFLIKDCLKRTLWAPALYFVALFFALPVSVILILQSFNRRLEYMEPLNDLIPDLTRQFSFIFGTNNGFIGAIMIVAAFVSGLTVFYYLHNKKRVDFFHSLPIKRETLFLNNYISGILFMLIPYFFNLIFALIAVVAFGYANYLSFLSLFLAAFQHIIFYIAIYSLGVFAAMFTGNLVIHGLFYAFLLIVGPAIIGMYPIIMEMFHPTFYTNAFPFITWVANSSPLAKYIEMLSVGPYLSGTEVIIILLAGIFLAALSLYLYKKRPSDSAGQAISFYKAKPFIKYLITFVVSIYMGLIFHTIGDTHSYTWLFFGVICGGLIISRIIEIVYVFDFHAIKKNLLSMVGFLVIICCLFIIPIFDLTGYDSYLPTQDQIAAIKIEMASVYSALETPTYYNNINEDAFAKSDKFLLTTKENIAAAYHIATIANQEKDTDDIYRYDEPGTWVTVCYQLTNGKKVYRDYPRISIRSIQQDIATIISSAEFKDNFYQLNQATNSNTEVNNLSLFESNTDYYTTIEHLNNEEKQAILEGLQADIKNMTQEQWETMLPLGELYFTVFSTPEIETDAAKPYYNYYAYRQRQYDTEYPVYPCYTNTLNILKQIGIAEQEYTPHINEVDYIVEYTETGVREKDDLEYTEPSVWETDNKTFTENVEQTRTIRDAATITQIMQTTHCISAFGQHPFLRYQSSPRYTVHFKENSNISLIDRAYLQQ